MRLGSGAPSKCIAKRELRFRPAAERAIHSQFFRRELRCLRNKIHVNLFVTFWGTKSCFIATAILQVRTVPSLHPEVQAIGKAIAVVVPPQGPASRFAKKLFGSRCGLRGRSNKPQLPLSSLWRHCGTVARLPRPFTETADRRAVKKVYCVRPPWGLYETGAWPSAGGDAETFDVSPPRKGLHRCYAAPRRPKRNESGRARARGQRHDRVSSATSSSEAAAASAASSLRIPAA